MNATKLLLITFLVLLTLDAKATPIMCSNTTFDTVTAQFTNDDLSNSVCDNAVLNAATAAFFQADLTSSSFIGTIINAGNLSFAGANLSFTDFSGATIITLTDTTFDNANVSFANFSGADLSSLALDDLNSWIGIPLYSTETLLPANFDPIIAGWRLVTAEVPAPATAAIFVLGVSLLVRQRRRLQAKIS